MSITSSGSGRRRVVFAPVFLGDPGLSALRIIPIWLASAAVHAAILGLASVLFMFLNSARGATRDSDEEMRTTTRIEELPKEFDPTDTDVGLEIGMPFSLGSDRLAEVPIPGEKDPTREVGLPETPADAIRTSVPPPPGGNAALGAPPDAEGDAKSGPSGESGGEDLLAGGLTGRNPGDRRRMLEKHGGNARSEAAVARGLEWLALHQAQDGHWSLHEFNHSARKKPRPAGEVFRCTCEAGATNRNDVAATAFGLLPFLAGGITHKPAKWTSKDYIKTVEGALNWMMAHQAKDGSFSGDMYAHGIATIAMCEAYGLTSDPRLKQSAQRAVNFIADAQDPAGGGWRYLPRQAGDLSVTGWEMMALKSGQMAGLSVPKKTLQKAEEFLGSCDVASNKKGVEQSGGYSYTPGGPETITMTSVGLLCRQYSGVNPRNPALLAGVQRLKAFPPDKLDSIYYLYYATQVMHHMQGESWKFWNLGTEGEGKGGIRDTLIARQDKGTTAGRAHQAGSWGGSPGGRMMATSLSLLCLEVYYRHLPLYRRDREVIKEGK